MSSRTSSDFGTIGERTGGRGAPPASEPEGQQSDAVRVVDPRHVWVDGTHAGLLLAWRHGADWQGRVFWCPPGLGEAALDWIPQQRLRPRG